MAFLPEKAGKLATDPHAREGIPEELRHGAANLLLTWADDEGSPIRSVDHHFASLPDCSNHLCKSFSWIENVLQDPVSPRSVKGAIAERKVTGICKKDFSCPDKLFLF